MKRRTNKTAIASLRPFVLLSWALIIGGTAMMVFAGIPLIIIATMLLLLSSVWWQSLTMYGGW